MGGALSILSFNDAPELVYLEGMSVGSLVQSSVDVTRYLSIYNLIQVHALLPDATKDLIKQIMEDDYPCEPGHLT
ncbi:hypothetical protein E1265_06885 [Streptomyces sp. 8K308]|nr:hypothetical protein E1265_06885 [Streptomyces sp. 8K308]